MVSSSIITSFYSFFFLLLRLNDFQWSVFKFTIFPPDYSSLLLNPIIKFLNSAIVFFRSVTSMWYFFILYLCWSSRLCWSSQLVFGLLSWHLWASLWPLFWIFCQVNHKTLLHSGIFLEIFLVTICFVCLSYCLFVLLFVCLFCFISISFFSLIFSIDFCTLGRNLLLSRLGLHRRFLPVHSTRDFKVPLLFLCLFRLLCQYQKVYNILLVLEILSCRFC